MYERSLAPRIRDAARSVLLLGPRQVGKSTLLSSLAPDLTLNLASPSIFRDYVTEPERLERELAAAEVDFVIEDGRDLWAIEVKASRRLPRLPSSGFDSLVQRSRRVRRKIIVFLGDRKQRVNDVEVLPLEDFLQELPS